MSERKKVLVVEEDDFRARALALLLGSWGYEPVVHVSALCEEICDWVQSGDFVSVVTWHDAYPSTGKRREMEEWVHLVKPGMPVIAINIGKLASDSYLDSEFHSGNDFPQGFARAVAEHLDGTCAVCAKYR